MTTRATAEPKETVTYESREAIMGCGCRIVMDAATYDAEGAHCAVHDNTEVVRVIKTPPVEIDAPPPEPPVAREGDDDDKPRRDPRTHRSR
ncbi:MAG TPA: hypothetical protein VN903_23025 [Polyangia bacterium]|nr:hypothetical protein [Polyangia bacterium]